MSPLQYQKWLRLNEARRLMLNEGFDAASVAFKVGYETRSGTKARRNSAASTRGSSVHHPNATWQVYVATLRQPGAHSAGVPSK